MALKINDTKLRVCNVTKEKSGIIGAKCKQIFVNHAVNGTVEAVHVWSEEYVVFDGTFHNGIGWLDCDGNSCTIEENAFKTYKWMTANKTYKQGTDIAVDFTNYDKLTICSKSGRSYTRVGYGTSRSNFTEYKSGTKNVETTFEFDISQVDGPHYINAAQENTSDGENWYFTVYSIILS